MVAPTKKKTVNSSIVRDTKAGDLFHYRWAATRALNLIAPDSELRSVSIEGASKPCHGDYIIDVEECFSVKKIVYQLKYSTKHPNKECPLSFLGGTLEGFGTLYKELKAGKLSTEYVFLTNRPVSSAVKNLFSQAPTNKGALKAINKYLRLSDNSAKQFCRRFKIIDSVESSAQQLRNVECRLMAMTSSPLINDEARALVDFVAEHAASQNHVLTKASILSYLGCSCADDLFPATARYDASFKAIATDSFIKTWEQIKASGQSKVVVHAAGGIGKTAFLRWVLSGGILAGDAILYDCYGGGLYRSSNELRHRIRDAFVEIINELYSKGLCSPILRWQSMSDDAICDQFWRHIKEAVAAIRCQGKDKELYLLIDAADNANIAAQENGDSSSFLYQLIHSHIPEGCRLVFTARSERMQFTDGVDDVIKVKLGGFSTEEVATLIHSQIQGEVTQKLAAAVKSFTKGNPRVILNLLSCSKTIDDLHRSISPNSPKTLPAIMAQKIDEYVRVMKRDHDEAEQRKLNRLFDALAVIPPTIPIAILAEVSGVEPELVESFIAEFGTSFWYDDSVVHFRDEPTETYFRNHYGKSIDSKRRVLEALKKINPQPSYAALAIPRLLFAIGDYDSLFTLSKTKDGIPTSNKAEFRHLLLLRLEYAYRAALKLKRFPDAISLAFLLASEHSGNAREKSMILTHLPFIATKISEEEVDLLCRDTDLSWGWKGSHNLAVAVLKAIRNPKSPSAASYLQSTWDWMLECFKEKKQKGKQQGQIAFQDVCVPSESEIGLMALVVYNIQGISECANWIGMWRPVVSRFKIAKAFASSFLASGGDVDILLALSNLMADDPAPNLAFNLVLSGYGKSIGIKAVESMITFLKSSESFSDGFQFSRNDAFDQAILSACETAGGFASLANDAAEVVVKRILRYTPYQGGRNFEARNYLFLHAYALWLVLTNQSPSNCDFESFLDSNYMPSDEHEKRLAALEIENRIGFYIESEKFFLNSTLANLHPALSAYEETLRSYEIRDWERWEIDASCIELKMRAKCIGLKSSAINAPQSWLSHKLRIDHIINIARRLMALGFEKDGIAFLCKANADISDNKDNDIVDETADWLMSMSEIAAKANKGLSQQFYDRAFEILSVVGDETLQHFDALKSLMRRACENKVDGSVVVRFLRCAEHAYKFDSKHFNSSGAFGIFAKNNMSDALAALSRFRDCGFYDFGYVLKTLMKGLVQYHGLSCEEVWAMRFFLDKHAQVNLLEYVLENCNDSQIRQKCFDEFVTDFSRSIERIDDSWLQLSDLTKRFSLNGKRIKPYVQVLKKRKTRHESYSAMPSRKTKGPLSALMRSIDFSSKTWLADYFKRSFDSYAASQSLLNNLPDNQYCGLLAQMSIPGGISIWNVCEILNTFPREKLGIDCEAKWNTAVGKIIKRFASEGEIVFLNHLVNHLSDTSVKLSCLRDCLSECSETVGIGSNICYAIVELASWLLNPSEAEAQGTARITSFEAEINDALGDSLSAEHHVATDNPRQTLAGLLWSALGSPVAWYRWNATYCVSALIENGSASLVKYILQYQGGLDIKPYISDGATFYDGFAEMFFAIAINHAAAKCPKSIADMIPWIVERCKNCQNVIIKWHYVEAILKSNHDYGNPPEKIVEELQRDISPRTPPIMMNSWGDCLPYAWDPSTFSSQRSIIEYDVEQYWLPPLARVFGIEERAFRYLFDRVFRRVAERHDKWPDRMRYDYDKRDYRNESCQHSHGSYPCAFAFSTYVSFIALGELAYELLSNYPVVAYPEEHDEWHSWLKNLLLERTDGFWLSDECDSVPFVFVSFNQFLMDLDEKQLSDALCKEVLKFASPIENAVPIGGAWETSAMRNRIRSYYYCVLAPQGEGKKYIEKLHENQNQLEYLIPCLYLDLVKPRFQSKGEWRGILQAWRGDDGSRFEKYDPNYGGFDHYQIMIDGDIQNLLGVRRANLGKSLYCGRKEIVKLARWGSGVDTWTRHDGPKHVGSVLWMSQNAISKIEKALHCDIIIGARIERKELFRDYFSRKIEQKYVWELARSITS